MVEISACPMIYDRVLPGFDPIRAHNAFPSCRWPLSFACNRRKIWGINLVGRQSDLWTINNETRIIATHKPIAKLSPHGRTRVQTVHRVAFAARAANRARSRHRSPDAAAFDGQSVKDVPRIPPFSRNTGNNAVQTETWRSCVRILKMKI